jgi:hypothetical protein
VYFLLKDVIGDIILSIKKARKIGWMKAFPSLAKMHHLYQVLTCKTKFDLSLMRSDDAEPAEEGVKQKEIKISFRKKKYGAWRKRKAAAKKSQVAIAEGSQIKSSDQ